MMKLRQLVPETFPPVLPTPSMTPEPVSDAIENADGEQDAQVSLHQSGERRRHRLRQCTLAGAVPLRPIAVGFAEFVACGLSNIWATCKNQ